MKDVEEEEEEDHHRSSVTKIKKYLRPVLKYSWCSKRWFFIDPPVSPIWNTTQDQEISKTHFEKSI